MNSSLVIGTRVVVLALLFYSIGIFIEQKKHKITNSVLITLSLGIVFDITATLFMIIGSPNSPFTLHGFLGYSALLGMLIDIVFMWRFRFVKGKEMKVDGILHLYSRFAYGWWVIAFITGALLVAMK